MKLKQRKFSFKTGKVKIKVLAHDIKGREWTEFLIRMGV
jgi:hypothetical protein